MSSVASGGLRGYPPLVPSAAHPIAAALCVAAACALSSSVPRPGVLSRALAAILLLMLTVQEVRFERSLIEDFTSLTGGRICNGSLHYLVNDADVVSNSSLQLFHGFGASSLSYIGLVNTMRSRVHLVATDLVGFGLNVRGAMSKYQGSLFGPVWNACASNTLIARSSEPDPRNVVTNRVIVGHSMGSVPAIASAALWRCLHPDTAITLILESPALILPLGASRGSAQLNVTQARAVLAAIGASRLMHLSLRKKTRRWRSLVRAPLALAGLLCRLALRRITSLDAFWRLCLRLAYYRLDPSGSLACYKLPTLAKGFDAQFLSFLSSQRTAELRYASPTIGDTGVSVLAALRALIATNVTVVLVHGVRDGVIPIGNSRAIKRALNSESVQLVEVAECGHVAHEEKLAEFSSLLDRYIPY